MTHYQIPRTQLLLAISLTGIALLLINALRGSVVFGDSAHAGIGHSDVSLTVAADTFAAKGGREDSKFHDTDSRLWVGEYLTAAYDDTITYLHFDLADLPPSAEVVQSTLHLYLKRFTNRPGEDIIPVEVRRVSSPWDPRTLTWAHRPTMGSVALSSTDVGIDFNSTKSWDIPMSLINDWLRSPGSNFGLAVITTDRGNPKHYARSFLSLDGFLAGDSGPNNHPPRLDLTYRFPATSTPSPSPSLTPTPLPDLALAIDAEGISGSLKPGTPVHPEQVIDFTVRSAHTKGPYVPEFRLCADIPTGTTLDRIVSVSPELTPMSTPSWDCVDRHYELAWEAKGLDIGKQLQVVYRVRVDDATPIPSQPPATVTVTVTDTATSSSTPPPSETATRWPPSTLTPTPGSRIDAGLLEPGSSVITSTVGMPSALVRGVALKVGLTDQPGQAPGLVGEAGYGPIGSDPSLADVAEWTFIPATYLDDSDLGFDRYVAAFIVPAYTAGRTYDMAYRFSLDGRVSWVYVDTSPSTTYYSPNFAGKLYVNPWSPLRFSRSLGLVLSTTTVPLAIGPVLFDSEQSAQSPPRSMPHPIVLAACAEGSSATLTPTPRDRSCILIGIPYQVILPFVSAGGHRNSTFGATPQ